jgi:hypothetical protein
MQKLVTLCALALAYVQRIWYKWQVDDAQKRAHKAEVDAKTERVYAQWAKHEQAIEKPTGKTPPEELADRLRRPYL